MGIFIPGERPPPGSGMPSVGHAPRSSTMGCREWTRVVRRASFKGVSFEVSEDLRSGGRRLVVQEYPNREYWDIEDMGMTAERVGVTGYLVGDDAEAQCHRLFEICNTPGSGTLYLPLRRPSEARCEKVESTFRESALGRFEVTMEFVIIAGQQGGLVPFAYLRGLVDIQSEKSAKVATVEFSLNFDTIMRRFSIFSFVPSVARDAAAREIQKAGYILDSIRHRVPMDGETGSKIDHSTRRMKEVPDKLARRGKRGDRYDSGIYVSDQDEVTSGIGALIEIAVGDIAKKGRDPEAAYLGLTDLAKYQADPIVYAPPAGTYTPRSIRAEQALTEEFAGHVRRQALIRSLQVATKRKYRSRSDAITTRANLTQAVQGEMRTTTDIKVTSALQEALSASVRFISQKADTLPSTITLQTPAALPAMVVATALYNDAKRDKELLDRNGVSHPLFMPQVIEADRPKEPV